MHPTQYGLAIAKVNFDQAVSNTYSTALNTLNHYVHKLTAIWPTSCLHHNHKKAQLLIHDNQNPKV
uniref:Uncharacterized protein n=1 Tax=Rhizophora mucronata TaxID=61149 RepID=A0A2P2NZ41_RHIMU